MLNKQKVLVVGGSSGLGLSIAKALLSEQAEVHIAARSNKKLMAALAYLKECVPKCDVHSHIVDMSDQTSIDKLYAEIKNIDHLVITAGVIHSAEFKQVDEAQAKEIFDINFWSKFRLVKTFSPQINQQGSVLLMSGIYGAKPNPKAVINSIAATAVDSLTKLLALSLKPIRVNAIAPYAVQIDELMDHKVDDSKRQRIAQLADTLPSQYVGNSDDIGAVVNLLLNNRYMTGAIINIDGGYSLL